MRRALFILTIVALAGAAWADWEPTMPAKWVQFPDVSPTGLDVRCGKSFLDPQLKVLADDFQCTATGPITNVHIWGSWLNDYLPFGQDPKAVDFRLSIRKDIPKEQSPTGYSVPGDPIWEGFFPSSTFTVRRVAITEEQFYDPNYDLGDPTPGYNGIIGRDSMCWQYNFDLAVAGTVPPIQEGTSARPMVYWLDVAAGPHDPQAVFGWKTSLNHWNDDAVWWDEGAGVVPKELRYPIGHPYEGQSIDLAFVIVPEPVTVGLLAAGAGGVLLRRRGGGRQTHLTHRSLPNRSD